ncbi:MAG: PQQ-binding-like beta-propeller repeat protein [Aureliella sp.]
MKLGESYGAPAIADGKLYQFDRYGDTERLSCYDANTTQHLWQYEYAARYRDSYGYNNGPRASPLIDGHRVYLFGVTGILTCVDTTTHQKIWQIDTSKEYGVVGNFFGVAANPLVYEDKLLVMVGGSPEESQQYSGSLLDRVKPNGTAVVAFDKLSGKELYRVGDQLASYSSICVHRIAGRDLGLAFARGGLLAWDARSGEQAFHFPWRADMLESVNAAMPVVDSDRVLVSEAYEIGSVLLDCSAAEPTVVWKDQKPRRSDNSFRAHWSTPVLVDGYLYGGNGRNQPDCDFRCVNFSTGEVMWKGWRHERASVLLIDGYLIALGELGTLKLLKPTPEKMEELRTVNLQDFAAEDNKPLVRSPCWAAPVVAGGKLYIRGREHLLCMQLTSAQK